MLIVNADDVGASRSTTDPVIEGFRRGILSSATAMVWMPDTDRAAALARQHSLPVGLHLNFTLPFGADTVPDEARERQLALTRAFDQTSWHNESGTAAADASLIAAGIADQLAEFRARFGEPTHLDGHHHVHVNNAVLAQLPHELAIRPPLAGEPRGVRQRWLLHRFRTPDACLPFGHVHPDLGGAGLDGLARARTENIEVMVHPAAPREYEALWSAHWREAVASLPLGSYRDLS